MISLAGLTGIINVGFALNLHIQRAWSHHL